MIKKVWKRIWYAKPGTLLRIAAVLTLIGLAFMVWSMVDPTPWPVLLAMSVGQVIGTLAFALYGLAVYKDLRRIRRERRESSQQIPIIKPEAEEAKS